MDHRGVRRGESAVDSRPREENQPEGRRRVDTRKQQVGGWGWEEVRNRRGREGKEDKGGTTAKQPTSSLGGRDAGR